jgi:hypothetical protein
MLSRVIALGMLACAATMIAAAAPQEQRSLTVDQVKARMDESDKLVADARARAKAGDAAATQSVLENYARTIEALERSLDQGRIEGDEFARVDALERAEKGAKAHAAALADLANLAPAAAKPAIEHAVEAARRCRDTAMVKLVPARVQRDAVAARRQAAPR